ncbi:MAG: hypothetical protein LQ348_003530 [Seirophora lacunosa]|nr:MAG: hypothetical protein LQ348_003530 [Seirophora lacunosa]
MLVPFPKDAELNQQLKSVDPATFGSCSLVRTDEPRFQCLPGRPRTLLHSDSLYQQLERDLCTPDLDTLAPHLWLVATQSSSHINPLHEQIVKGCAVVVTENPELHLAWADNRIFIKPVPPYLLSHAFWTTQLLSMTPQTVKGVQNDGSSSAIVKAALGYMRTYYHLVQHESDLHIAQEARLLPSDITLEQFHAFIGGFGDVQDDQVSPRYSTSGTLRLSRLNMWAKVFLRRFQFYHINRQYGEYFARFYGPILFFLAILAVVLGAMQVGLQANSSSGDQDKGQLTALEKTSLWFSIATLIGLCGVGLVLALLLVFMWTRELVYATKDLVRRRRGAASKGAEEGFSPERAVKEVHIPSQQL